MLSNVPPQDRSSNDDDERELRIRIRAGDTTAFRVLVERHVEALTRVAFYLTRSRDTADDVVQSVFIQLWSHRATIDPTRPMRPYLLRAVRNRSMDELKSESVRERYVSRAYADANTGSTPVSSPGHETFVLTRATVESALKQLSPRRRTALSLWLMDELSDVDVAHVLNTSVEAADRLIRRALADLRDILEKL